MLIPTNEVFTMQMKLFFASTLMGILCFAFETVNQTTVALALPLFWVFFKVAPATVAFQPWTQYIPWMMLSGLLMANVLESTGLLSRVAYFCILKTGATYKGILIGLAAAGFLAHHVRRQRRCPDGRSDLRHLRRFGPQTLQRVRWYHADRRYGLPAAEYGQIYRPCPDDGHRRKRHRPAGTLGLL